jgi:hypothetical protein
MESRLRVENAGQKAIFLSRIFLYNRSGRGAMFRNNENRQDLQDEQD